MKEQDLVDRVAEIICRRFYWGKHMIQDPQVQEAATEIVRVVETLGRTEEG